MRIRPTALGVKGALFFAAVTVLYLATPYSNLFFLLTAFLATLGVVGVLGAIANIRRVAARLVHLAPAPADGVHAVDVQLAPTGRRQAFGIHAWLDIGGRRVPVAESVVVDRAVTATGSVGGFARGVRPARALLLRSRHPLGLCVVERRVPLADTEVVTYPHPASFTADRDGEDPRADARLRALASPEEAVAGLRTWRDGDSLREIHWKATARRGEPVVKERERDQGTGLEVVLDRRCEPAVLERALAVATALVLDAGEHQQPLRLRSQGLDLVHSADQPATPAMLRWLAAATPLPHTAAPPPPGTPVAIHLPHGTTGGLQ